MFEFPFYCVFRNVYQAEKAYIFEYEKKDTVIETICFYEFHDELLDTIL